MEFIFPLLKGRHSVPYGYFSPPPLSLHPFAGWIFFPYRATKQQEEMKRGGGVVNCFARSKDDWNNFGANIIIRSRVLEYSPLFFSIIERIIELRTVMSDNKFCFGYNVQWREIILREFFFYSWIEKNKFRKSFHLFSSGEYLHCSEYRENVKIIFSFLHFSLVTNS